MKLEVDDPRFGYYQSSNMQGVLMGRIGTEYAEKLHEQGIKPYSQCVLRAEKEWVVKTCTEEAYREIIQPLLDPGFTQFAVEKKGIHGKIREKQLKTLRKSELMEAFYSDAADRYLRLEFLTPTSFKSNGKYVIIPGLRHIYQSLMNKYSACSDTVEMYDEDTLEQLVELSSIVGYRLKSAHFPLEGIRIPAFKGEIIIRTEGTDTMAKYAMLLARFGEYSGVGVKTAMGMGALQIRERGEAHDG